MVKPGSNDRRSARVILLNAAQEVLLIRFVVDREHKPFVSWATPGGSIEDGETDLDAARRELAEELALNVVLTGPVHTVASKFEHESKLVDNIDVFFPGRYEHQGIALHFATQAERAAMKEIKWWTIGELERSSEACLPRDLASVLRSLPALTTPKSSISAR